MSVVLDAIYEVYVADMVEVVVVVCRKAMVSPDGEHHDAVAAATAARKEQ